MELKKQKTYKTVFELARKQLLSSDIHERLICAGFTFTQKPAGYVADCPFFDETITLSLPGCTFSSPRGANITLVTKIIILHYINTATGVSLAGHMPFEEIPSLRHYLPVFEKRVIKPLVAAFGYNRDAFREAGFALGGHAEEYGDTSFTLHAFPRVPITFILWEGDEEFPPSVRILYDRSITGYLPLEDIAVISKLASARIIREARKLFMDEV